ncbi:MAG TPA: DUF697 domain-containing protein [Xanthobacteraceae bacterium]
MAHNATASTTPEQGVAVAEATATPAETPDAERRALAAKLVNRFAVWSGVAGLIPLPVVDVVAVGGLQIQMLRRLSHVYGVAFSENRGKALIAGLGGALIPASSGMGAASALKAVPVIGTVASGVVMPVLSAGATYAIGKAFIEHFASGGTLLDFNPPDYREFVKAQKQMWESKSTAPATQSAEPSPAPAAQSAEPSPAPAAQSAEPTPASSARPKSAASAGDSGSPAHAVESAEPSSAAPARQKSTGAKVAGS